MRRLILGLLALAVITLAAEVASAQNAPVNGFCEQGGNTITGTGNATPQKMQQSFPACTVTVFNFGTSNLSTIFSDAGGTPKGNPFTADGFGRWQYFAPNGDYIVQLSGGGITGAFTLYSDIRISGATAGVGGSGTTGTLPVFTASAAVGNSIASQVTSGKNSLIVAGGGGFPGEIDLGNVNNGNVVGFKSPANPAGSYVPTFPAADAVGCVQSNGAGVWSISACSGGVNNVTSASPITANQIVIGQDGTRGVQQLGSLGTTSQVLIGNAAGAPTFGTVALASMVSGVLPNGNLTGSGAITINGTAPITAPGSTALGGTAAIACPTCVTSAAALTNTQIVLGSGSQATHIMASPGTTTQLLHGNAAGDPTFSAVSLTADVSGLLPTTNAGFGVNVSGSSGLVSVSAGTFIFNPISSTQVQVGAAGNTTISAAGLTYNSTNQGTTLTGLAVAGGAPLLTLAPASPGTVTANVNDVVYTAPAITLTGGYAEQDFWKIGQPTISGAQTITNTSTITLKGLAIPAGGAVLTNRTELWTQQGNTNLFQTVNPGVICPCDALIDATGTYAVNTPLPQNVYQIASTVITTGTTPAVGIFGFGRSDSAVANAEGGNFAGYANANGAIAAAVELDSGVFVAGGHSYALVMNLFGSLPSDKAAIQLGMAQINSTVPSAYRIIAGTGGPIPTTGNIFDVVGAMTVTNGIDFSPLTISGSFLKGPSSTFVAKGDGTLISQAAGTTFRAFAATTYMQAQAADAVTTTQVIDSYGAGTRMVFRRADGPSAVPTAVQSSEQILAANIQGYDGAAFVLGAQWSFNAGENWDGTHHAGQMNFQTIGAIDEALNIRFFLDAFGNVNVGNGVAGKAQLFYLSTSTFANLGTFLNGNAGMVYCTDCKNVATDAAAAGSVAVAAGTGTFVFRVNGAWRIFF